MRFFCMLVGMMLYAGMFYAGAWGAGPAAAAEGRIVIVPNNTPSPVWFHPTEHQGGQSSFWIYYALHDAVLKPLYDDTYTKSLAESWSVSLDGLTYEFVLRPNLTFHNGDRLTSEDVKFSFDRYRGSGASQLKAAVSAVEIPDERRVRFRLTKPWPDFLSYYATPTTGAAWVLPKNYIERVGEDEYKRKPIGAGPYRFASYTPGVDIVFEAYDGYWRKKPSIKTIVLRTGPDEITRSAMLKSGEADIAFLFRGTVAEDLQKTKGIGIRPIVVNFSHWLIFPEQWDPASPWSKRAVREAVLYALNRDNLNKAEYLGYAKPAGSIVPPTLPLGKDYPPYPYDPARARKLLAEAGYPGGFDGGEINTEAGYVIPAEIIQSDLAAVGIRTSIRPMQRPTYNTLWFERKMKGILLAMASGYDNAGIWMTQFASPDGRGSFGSYPDVAELLARPATILNETERQKLVDQAQDLLRERVMFAPLLNTTALHAFTARVKEPGIGLIKGFAYVGPYEDLELAR